jgi:hypothetical protein
LLPEAAVSGKKNKARRKQERAASRRSQCGPGQERICALYSNQPRGELYREWAQFASTAHASRWLEAAMQAPGADQEPGALDWARRVASFAAVYRQMVPADAACHLDLHIDNGILPILWGGDETVTDVPGAEIARMIPGMDTRSGLEVRFAIHQLHAMGWLMLLDDGTVIVLIPDNRVGAADEGASPG